MPSPFPGMDPYLEASGYWRGFHNTLIAFIEGDLNRSLPTGFSANAEERVYLLPSGREAIPDVVVHDTRLAYGGTPVASAPVPGAGEPHGTISVAPYEAREMFVQVRRADRPQDIITIIEVLSPANKMLGGPGREQYQRKQETLLRSGTHLMEVDLLRAGEHTVAAPRHLLAARGRWDYLVCLNRATSRDTYEYWFVALREPLPLVRVPLTPGIDDVVLDLQQCFALAYDAGPYSRDAIYAETPPVALGAEDAAWADALLREKGLRG